MAEMSTAQTSAPPNKVQTIPLWKELARDCQSLGLFYTFEEDYATMRKAGSPLEIRQVAPAGSNVDNAADLIQHFSAVLSDVAVSIDASQPRVIHFVDRSILTDTKNPLNEKITLHYVGTPEGLIDKLRGLMKGRIGNIRGLRGEFFGDHTTRIEVNLNGQPIREALDQVVPAPSLGYGQVYSVDTQVLDNGDELANVLFSMPPEELVANARRDNTIVQTPPLVTAYFHDVPLIYGNSESVVAEVRNPITRPVSIRESFDTTISRAGPLPLNTATANDVIGDTTVAPDIPLTFKVWVARPQAMDYGGTGGTATQRPIRAQTINAGATVYVKMSMLSSDFVPGPCVVFITLCRGQVELARTEGQIINCIVALPTTQKTPDLAPTTILSPTDSAVPPTKPSDPKRAR
jgi:hypothetical protein